MSYQFTFASAIIIKRGCADIDYIRTHTSIHLVPANIILSTVGRYDDVLVSEDRLLTARGSSTPGERLTIFSKEIFQLFRMNAALGYEASIFRKMYNESLLTVLVDAAKNYGVTWRGAYDLARYSFGYEAFYTYVLPILAGRLFPAPLVKTGKVVCAGVAECVRISYWAVRKFRRYFVGPRSISS